MRLIISIEAHISTAWLAYGVITLPKERIIKTVKKRKERGKYSKSLLKELSRIYNAICK